MQPPIVSDEEFDWLKWTFASEYELFDVRSATSFPELVLGDIERWKQVMGAVTLVVPRLNFRDAGRFPHIIDASQGILVIPRVMDCVGMALRIEYEKDEEQHHRVLAFHHFVGSDDIGRLNPIATMIKMLDRDWTPVGSNKKLGKNSITKVETFFIGLNNPTTSEQRLMLNNGKGRWRNKGNIIDFVIERLNRWGIHAEVANRVYRVMEVLPQSSHRAIANSVVPVRSLVLNVRTGDSLLFEQNVQHGAWLLLQKEIMSGTRISGKPFAGIGNPVVKRL